MAKLGDHDQDQNHVDEEAPERRRLLSKVKDSLNFTKHLGFVSDLDSPAAQAALAEMHEREERQGKSEEIPRPALSDAVKEGAKHIKEAVVESNAVAVGAVAPRSETPDELTRSQLEKSEGPGAVANNSAGNEHDDTSPVAYKESSSPDVHLSKDSKPHRLFGRHKGKEDSHSQSSGGKDPKEEDQSFFQWAAHTAKKVGHVVASKDLSDDLVQKQSKAQGNRK